MVEQVQKELSCGCVVDIDEKDPTNFTGCSPRCEPHREIFNSRTWLTTVLNNEYKEGKLQFKGGETNVVEP